MLIYKTALSVISFPSNWNSRKNGSGKTTLEVSFVVFQSGFFSDRGKIVATERCHSVPVVRALDYAYHSEIIARAIIQEQRSKLFKLLG